MIVVGLTKGKIELRATGEKPKCFAPSRYQAMGDFILKHGFDFIGSSSCDFPHENGFPKKFRVAEPLSRAIEYARAKTAYRLAPLAPKVAADFLEGAAESWEYPKAVFFTKAGVKKEDLYLIFGTRAEFDSFLIGMKYAIRLQQIRAEDELQETWTELFPGRKGKKKRA